MAVTSLPLMKIELTVGSILLIALILLDYFGDINDHRTPEPALSSRNLMYVGMLVEMSASNK